MTKQTKEVKTNVIRELRSLMPHRPLTYSDAYTLAEKQATRALELLGQTSPHVSLEWVCDLPRVEILLVPRFKSEHIAGSTTFKHGKYFITVNKNDVHTRRRFTLGHETKHLLDRPLDKLIYRELGHGDDAKRERQIEKLCDYFSACLLMPRAWVKKYWYQGLQDLTALAGLFNVSEDAMYNRLTFLGFIDPEPERDVRTYFRLAAPRLLETIAGE